MMFFGFWGSLSSSLVRLAALLLGEAPKARAEVIPAVSSERRERSMPLILELKVGQVGYG